MYDKSCGWKSCQTGHCRLEMPLTLSCKSPRYLTHQKIKEFYAQLYSWHFEAKNNDKSNVQDKKQSKSGRVAWWLATCARKPKVPGSSPAASYAQR